MWDQAWGSDCHFRLLHSVAGHAKNGVYVQQDLHRFFGSIQLDTITAVLRRLHAPDMLVDLVPAFTPWAKETSS